MFSELALPWISSQNLPGAILLLWAELKGPTDSCSNLTVATQAGPKWCHLKGNVVPARVSRARHRKTSLRLLAQPPCSASHLPPCFSSLLICQWSPRSILASHLCPGGLAPLSPHGLGLMKNVCSRKVFPRYLCYLRQGCSVTGMWLTMWED